VLLYTKNGRVIAAANMLPSVWDGTQEGLPAGWDAALAQVAQEHVEGRSPTALLAVSVTVDLQYQGQGISSIMLGAIHKNAAYHGFQCMIAPVRPTWKSHYPFIAMQEYIGWTRENGEPFDPWIRVHARLGGKILTVAPRSMVVRGTIAEWEAWAGTRFPRYGAYAVSGALHPVILNYEKNEGLYEEPNVWVVNTITAEERAKHRPVDQSNWRKIIMRIFSRL